MKLISKHILYVIMSTVALASGLANESHAVGRPQLVRPSAGFFSNAGSWLSSLLTPASRGYQDLSDNQKFFCKATAVTTGISLASWAMWSYFKKQRTVRPAGPQPQQQAYGYYGAEVSGPYRSYSNMLEDEEDDKKSFASGLARLSSSVSSSSSSSASFSSSESYSSASSSSSASTTLPLVRRRLSIAEVDNKLQRNVVPAMLGGVKSIVQSTEELGFIPGHVAQIMYQYYGYGADEIALKKINTADLQQVANVFVATGELGLIPNVIAQIICQYYGSGKECLITFNYVPEVPSNHMPDVALSPDGQSIAHEQNSFFITVRRIKDDINCGENYLIPKELSQFLDSQPRFSPVAFSPEGNHIAAVVSGSDAAHLLLWTLETHGCVYVQLPERSRCETRPAFSTDGSKVAVSLKGGTTNIYAISNDQLSLDKTIVTKKVAAGNGYRVALSRDGRFLAQSLLYAWGYAKTKMWNIAQSEKPMDIVWGRSYGAPVFSHDGRMFVTMCDKSLQVIDCETGSKATFTFPLWKHEFVGAMSPASGMQFSSDDTALYVWFHNGARCCCNLEDGTVSVVDRLYLGRNILYSRDMNSSEVILSGNSNKFIMHNNKHRIAYYTEVRDESDKNLSLEEESESSVSSASSSSSSSFSFSELPSVQLDPDIVPLDVPETN